jgi:hypothetical protein
MRRVYVCVVDGKEEEYEEHEVEVLYSKTYRVGFWGFWKSLFRRWFKS